MRNSIEKLRDLPKKAKQMRMMIWSDQKRSLAIKGSVEKREASYKWGIMTAKKKNWSVQLGTLEEETARVEWRWRRGNNDVTKKHALDIEETVPPLENGQGLKMTDVFKIQILLNEATIKVNPK